MSKNVLLTGLRSARIRHKRGTATPRQVEQPSFCPVETPTQGVWGCMDGTTGSCNAMTELGGLQLYYGTVAM